jgi:ABC-2 type transport system permease protein
MRGLIRREALQLLRDRRLLAFMLGLPFLQVLLYGYAVHFSVYHLPMAVVDRSHDARSREFVRALVNSQYFDVKQQLDSEDQAIDAIDNGDVKVGVVIPDRFATRTDKSGADVLFMFDGSDSASVQSGYTAAVLVAQDYALQLAVREIAPSGSSAGRTPATLPIEASTRVLYNPDLVDIWLILPGLVGIVLQTVAVQQASLSVVRDYEQGTLEQILVTPVRPLEIMISKIIPLLVLSLTAMGVVLVTGVFWFGVPFQGNLILYFWLALLFIASCLGLGLLLSARARTQMEATQMSLLLMMVGVLLSGFVYPLEMMPPVPRFIGSLFPVTYFIRLSRAVFTKGVGVRFVWSDMLILAAYGVVVTVLAARTFKRSLD